MITTLHHGFRVLSLFEPFYLIFLAAVLGTTGQAQELSQKDMDKTTGAQGSVGSEDIQADGSNQSIQPNNQKDNILGTILKWGPFDVHLNGESSVVYNDNIYIQKQDKTSDLIWTLSPHLTLGAGDYLQKEESWLAIDYTPSFIHFTEHDNNDAIDQDARINFEWHPANWTLGLKQSYQKLSAAIVEVGGRVDRSIYDTGLYARYDLSPKTAFEIDADQSINDYGPSLYSFNQWTLATWSDYWVTPKIRMGIGATAGFIDVVRNPNQSYQQGLLRGEYDVTEGITIHGSTGAEWREFQGSSSSRADGVFSLGGVYQPLENTSFLFNTYRHDETSLTAAGENYTVTGFSAGVSQIVAEKYTFSFSGGLDHSAYYATTPEGDAKSSFDYFYLRPGVEWHVSSQLTAGAFYQYQDNVSAGSNVFSNNLSGLTVVYHF